VDEGTRQKYRAPQFGIGLLPAQHQQWGVNARSRLHCWILSFVNTHLTPSLSTFVETILPLVGKMEPCAQQWG